MRAICFLRGKLWEKIIEKKKFHSGKFIEIEWNFYNFLEGIWMGFDFVWKLLNRICAGNRTKIVNVLVDIH